MAAGEVYVGEYIDYSPFFPNFFTCVKEIISQLKSEVIERLVNHTRCI